MQELLLKWLRGAYTWRGGAYLRDFRYMCQVHVLFPLSASSALLRYLKYDDPTVVQAVLYLKAEVYL